MFTYTEGDSTYSINLSHIRSISLYPTTGNGTYAISIYIEDHKSIIIHYEDRESAERVHKEIRDKIDRMNGGSRC